MSSPKLIVLRYPISSGITKVNREVGIVLRRKVFIVFPTTGEELQIVDGVRFEIQKQVQIQKSTMEKIVLDLPNGLIFIQIMKLKTFFMWK